MVPATAARRRLLDTAHRLFSRHGIRGVGIDTLIQEAGVAKATLYSHFPSKADLVAAYLDDQSEAWAERMTQLIDDNTEDAVRRLFTALGRWSAEPDFSGCLWANARSEQLREPVVDEALARHRARMRAVFAQLDPDHVDELLVLYDGTIATARLDPAADAPAAAARLAAAVTGGPRGEPEPQRRRAPSRP